MLQCVFEFALTENDQPKVSLGAAIAHVLRALLVTLCVRRIDARRLWDEPSPEEAWLSRDDLRADALRDLATSENKLSIWLVDESAGATLARILAAIAARRENLAKLDFAIFDFPVVDKLEIPSERVAGDTYDDGVNACHLNIIHLTAHKLAALGASIRATGKIQRYPDKTVAKLIKDSIDRKFMRLDQLAPGLARRVYG